MQQRISIDENGFTRDGEQYYEKSRVMKMVLMGMGISFSVAMAMAYLITVNLTNHYLIEVDNVFQVCNPIISTH